MNHETYKYVILFYGGNIPANNCINNNTRACYSEI